MLYKTNHTDGYRITAKTMGTRLTIILQLCLAKLCWLACDELYKLQIRYWCRCFGTHNKTGKAHRRLCNLDIRDNTLGQHITL